MGLIQMVVVGFVVGLIARALMPGQQRLGIFVTSLLGIVGSAVANLAGTALGWYSAGAGAGVVASVAGALAVLFLAGRLNEGR